MELFFAITELVLPVLVMILIGVFCRVKNLFGEEVLDGIKKLITNFLLPAVIFGALARMEFSGTVLILAALCLVMDVLALGVGFLTKPLLKEYGTYHPFLMAGYEVGLLGFALFPLLVGAENIGFLASLDAGGCIFFFCIYLPILQRENGVSGSAKETIKNIFTAPSLIACIIGLLCSATGLGNMLFTSAVGPTIDATLSLVTSPTTALILVIVGYNLKLQKDILLPVLKTSLLRLVTMAGICVLAILFLQLIGITDALVIYSLIFMSALSAPYIVSVYAKGEKQISYISTQVSLYSIVIFIVFVVMRVVLV